MEMDNRDVIATADFTDTLTKEPEITPPEDELIPTPIPSSTSGNSYMGGNNYSGGSTIHIGNSSTTVSSGSNTSATNSGTISGRDTVSNSSLSANSSAVSHKSTVSDGSKSSSIKTGDESNPLLMFILMFMAAGICVIVLYVRKRKVNNY